MQNSQSRKREREDDVISTLQTTLISTVKWMNEWKRCALRKPWLKEMGHALLIKSNKPFLQSMRKKLQSSFPNFKSHTDETDKRIRTQQLHSCDFGLCFMFTSIHNMESLRERIWMKEIKYLDRWTLLCRWSSHLVNWSSQDWISMPLGSSFLVH